MKSVTVFILSAFWSLSCTSPKNFFQLGPVEEENELVVLIRNSDTTYEINEFGNPSGFEYELVSAFARTQGWKLNLQVRDSTQEVLKDLADGRAHMAASGLTVTEQRKKLFKFSKSYQTVKQKVVCGKRKNVKSKKDLKNLDLIVVDGTSHEESLTDLQAKHSDITFKTLADNSEATLELIWNNRDLCTLIDSHILKVHRRYFPELRVAYELSDEEPLAWAIGKTDSSLQKKVDQWLTGPGKVKIEELKNKYYGYLKDFDYYDTKKFLERIESRLPKYKKYFQQASKETGLDWTFLAAVAYQESQWDPDAVSPTGVRGIMMLTKNTAKEMKVKNRRAPAQSIDGGSRYLAKLLERVPSYVKANDRKWFALAAYNLGFYHLRDGQALTVLQNKDPGKWQDVRQVLPLLSQRKYYKNLRYGYARGLEPVIYVSRIRNYHDLLLNQL